MKSSNFFILHSNCIPIKGSKRALIFDLQRNKFKFIPLDLFDILDSENRSIDFNRIIENQVDDDSKEIIIEYFDFLKEQDFGFWSLHNLEHLFPKLSKEWDVPSIISNAIIDLNTLNLSYFSKIINQLVDLNCLDFQVRFFTELNLNSLKSILTQLENSKIKSIEIFFKWYNDINLDLLNSVVEKNKRVKALFIYNAPKQLKSIYKSSLVGHIIFLSSPNLNVTDCGNISPSYFAINNETYTESQQHNTCLNRKISIDVNGEIKNCPSMTKSYGNIKDTTLAEAIEKTGFKDLWFINKDKIHVCKDCEFRYICTDCRAYIENPEDIYSKPLKCGYNPYSAEWEEWSTNPLKQKAIEFYGMQELVKKEK